MGDIDFNVSLETEFEGFVRDLFYLWGIIIKCEVTHRDFKPCLKKQNKEYPCVQIVVLALYGKAAMSLQSQF